MAVLSCQLKVKHQIRTPLTRFFDMTSPLFLAQFEREFSGLEKPSGRELEHEEVDVHRGADGLSAEAGGDGYPADKMTVRGRCFQRDRNPNAHKTEAMNELRSPLRETFQWERMPGRGGACKLRIEFTGLDSGFEGVEYRRNLFYLPNRDRLSANDQLLAVRTCWGECNPPGVVTREPLPAGVCGLVHIERGASLTKFVEHRRPFRVCVDRLKTDCANSAGSAFNKILQ
jgi:hypothetical protein